MGRETGRVPEVAARCAGACLWRPVERRCYRFAENGLVPSTPPANISTNVSKLATAAGTAVGSVKRLKIPARFGAVPSPLIV